ncbi:MAG: membrane protein of unknown function [Promethearchaeota archaeon]|nr:MAG: membrane protein of unknown function [Candidatus Lokiarchaeota archaeon]
MFLIFHVAIPLLIFEIPYLKKHFKINRFCLALGAILPDIIDKLLLILFRLGDGRYIGHTLIFPCICLIGLLSMNELVFRLKKNQSNDLQKTYIIPVSIFIGIFIHHRIGTEAPSFRAGRKCR